MVGHASLVTDPQQQAIAKTSNGKYVHSSTDASPWAYGPAAPEVPPSGTWSPMTRISHVSVTPNGWATDFNSIEASQDEALGQCNPVPFPLVSHLSPEEGEPKLNPTPIDAPLCVSLALMLGSLPAP